MELRIFLNNGREQLLGVSRDDLCDFKDNFLDKFPYPVHNGHLESTANGFVEESANGFVGFKTLHRREDVVLYHRQREAGYLCGEVARLAFAHVQQGLAIVVGDFNRPSHRVRPVGREELEREVSGEQPIPTALATALAEEQPDGCASIFHVDGAVGAPERLIVLAGSLLLEMFDDLRSVQPTEPGFIGRIAQLDHAQEMARNMTAGNQTDELGVCEPAVHQQIIEAVALEDSHLYHLDSLVGLLHEILLTALLSSLATVVIAHPGVPFLFRQSLLLVSVLALFAMEGEVDERLADAVGIQQREALEAEDALVHYMRVDAADELGLLSTLWRIGIIQYQAPRLLGAGIAKLLDLAKQMAADAPEYRTPVDTTIIHKPIEHVLLTSK